LHDDDRNALAAGTVLRRRTVRLERRPQPVDATPSPAHLKPFAQVVADPHDQRHAFGIAGLATVACSGWCFCKVLAGQERGRTIPLTDFEPDRWVSWFFVISHSLPRRNLL
jgi:hypothetical protein